MQATTDARVTAFVGKIGAERHGLEVAFTGKYRLPRREHVAQSYLSLETIGFSAISVIALFLKRDQATIQDAKARLALLIPALIPMLWILVVSNHSWNHTWFTYRTLAPSIFSLLSLLSPFDSKPVNSVALQ